MNVYVSALSHCTGVSSDCGRRLKGWSVPVDKLKFTFLPMQHSSQVFILVIPYCNVADVPEMQVHGLILCCNPVSLKARSSLSTRAVRVGSSRSVTGTINRKPTLVFRQLCEKESSTYTYWLADVAHPDRPAVNKIPGVKSAVSRASEAKSDVQLGPGERIIFGNLYLEVRTTPGHTKGCVTYETGEGSERPNPRTAFTGDTLLIRGCGLTDFSGWARKPGDVSSTKMAFCEVPQRGYMSDFHEISEPCRLLEFDGCQSR